MSKIELKMRERIIKKIEDAGADSKKKAVSVATAEFDLQEQYWLPYLVGTFKDSIKKTNDSRYYCETL
jgi:predicted Holliday junction resolvase-like endonuclease